MRVTLPKGNYYVGDPFLVLDQTDWPDFSDLPKNDVEQFKGVDVVWVETSRDHAEYVDDNTGDLIDVSSGYIAVIPLSILDDDTSGGTIVESSSELVVTIRTADEYFKFGKMKLVPYSELDEEEEEEPDDWLDWN